MSTCHRSVAAGFLLSALFAGPLRAQPGPGIELGVGSALPAGRLADLQDAGLRLAIAVDGWGGSGWTLRGAAAHTQFKADSRQHSPYVDGAWLPFDLEMWSLTVQWVRRDGGGSVAVRPAFGLGIDYLGSPRVYGALSASPGRFREVYPAGEGGVEVGWRPHRGVRVFGAARAHLTVARLTDTERLFEAAGSRAGDEHGTRWLASMPLMFGVRLRF